MSHNFENIEWRSEKIVADHLERLAVVYVRQSTLQQVLDHQESTRLQYGLVNRAQALGWSQERVLVIDDDLGKSGASAEGREGFQRLVAEVGLNHVGLILGVEMSRLARSSLILASTVGNLRIVWHANSRSRWDLRPQSVQ